MDVDCFSQCPCCGTRFTSRDILESADVVPLGMTFAGDDLGFNLLYFNHAAPDCGSTFTIEARRFAPFLTETPPADSQAGQPGCDHHCMSMSSLTACVNECYWAPYRRFLLQLRAQRSPASA